MSLPTPVSPCDKLEKTVIEQHIDAETIESIGKECRTLPMFEKSVFELKFKKLYSLVNNKRFACRWSEFVDRKPGDSKSFHFPSFRDLHFYQNSVYHKPSETIYKRKDFKMKMSVGPGVDWRGQMPIPNELHLRKGLAPKERKRQAKEFIDKKNVINKGKETVGKKPGPKTKHETKKEHENLTKAKHETTKEPNNPEKAS